MSAVVARLLEKNGDRYVVTFDEYGVVDTISRNGVTLMSTNRDAQTILRSADGIYAMTAAPRGFKFARRGAA